MPGPMGWLRSQADIDIAAIRRTYADGSDTFLTTATCRQDVRFLLRYIDALEAEHSQDARSGKAE